MTIENNLYLSVVMGIENQEKSEDNTQLSR